MSVTVPVPNSNASRYSNSLTADDFVGISISPVLSKVIEHCLLDRYSIVNTSSPAKVNAYLAVHMQ